MKPQILIILPRGETIRNFIYTGIVKDVMKYFHVTLYAVKPNETIWKLLSESSDQLYELKTENFSYGYKIFFEIFDLAHNRYMWSEAAKVRWEMRDVEANSIKKKIIRRIKKSIAILLAHRKTLQWAEKIDAWLASKEKQVLEYQKFLLENKFDLVFNTSHSHARIALPLVYAANNLNIKTTTFLYSWDNLTSQGRVVPKYDFYFAWNSKIKNDFHTIYPHVKKNQVIVTGTPQFINHFDEDKCLSKKELYEKLGLNLEDKYFLYSSGMSHHMPYEPYVVERIADIIYSIDPEIKLVVRTYAKDKASVFRELKTRRKDILIPEVDWEPNFQTPLLSDQEFFVSLMKNAIAGINVASTVSLELCMLNKPAINVGYNPPDKNIYPYNYTRFYSFDHYKPIVESGAVQVAINEAHLKKLLENAIENPKEFAVERQKLIADFFENNLSQSIKENFVSVIATIHNEK
ncbi:hypothetical protein GOQ30_00795 [Flavobacterium sp. TP390]|uniref:UDP-glycosyltransferase n=1 Tax=Flavobacterium profundi TaxID=1774945 RepID=A0A6I4IRE3_9FLAO|nr:hypothetical protein [Flavobacterium profundi]MVO07696.1 hypothetical protein [Flavobacterium profundi]